MRDPHDMQVKSITGISCKTKNEFFKKEKKNMLKTILAQKIMRKFLMICSLDIYKQNILKQIIFKLQNIFIIYNKIF